MSNKRSNSIFSRILEASLALDDRLNNQNRPEHHLSEFLALSRIFRDFSADNDTNFLLEELNSEDQTVISLDLSHSNSNALAFGLLYAEKVVVTLPKLDFDNFWDNDEGTQHLIKCDGFKEFTNFCIQYKNDQ